MGQTSKETERRAARTTSAGRRDDAATRTWAERACRRGRGRGGRPDQSRPSPASRALRRARVGGRCRREWRERPDCRVHCAGRQLGALVASATRNERERGENVERGPARPPPRSASGYRLATRREKTAQFETAMTPLALRCLSRSQRPSEIARRCSLALSNAATRSPRRPRRPESAPLACARTAVSHAVSSSLALLRFV